MTGLDRPAVRFLLGFALAASMVTGCTGVATPTPLPTVAATVASTTAPQATASPTIAAATATPSATGLAGTFAGSIEVAGQVIGIEVTFTTEDGVLAGDMDIAAQGAFGIPLENVTVDGSSVSFTILSGANLAAFAGAVDADGNIAGSFSQAGYTGEFSIERKAVVELPYRQEEVTFGHDDITLAGTLSLPEGEGPFPAVVLISGSGAQDRDENVYGFRVFFTLADHLTRNGVAVLRYDDRGVGGSTGDLTQATQDDLAQDVVAAVDLLLTRDDIDGSSIGLIGHSEGGIVAPLAANLSADIAYVVLLAGPATPGEEVLVDQLELILRAQGFTEEEIAAAKERQARTLAAARTGEGWDEVAAEAEAELRAAIESLSSEQREALGDVDEYVEYAIAAEIAGVDNPWFRSFIDYDPVPALTDLKVPVLALFGSLDTQVPADKNAEDMRQALESAGVDFRIEILDRANHLFQAAETGGVDEYANLEAAFVPGFLDLVTEWVERQSG